MHGSKSVRVDELDGLRGLLALWVVTSHILSWTGFWEMTLQNPFGRLWTEFLMARGAVDTFMILSGFAISFLLHQRQQTYGQFIKGRLFRIYPVYFVCLILGLASSRFVPFILDTSIWNDSIYLKSISRLSVSELSATCSHFVWHMTLLHGLIPRGGLENSAGTLLAPAWSISLEWQYYLLAPVIAKAARTGGGLIAIVALSWLGLRFSHFWQNPELAFIPAQLPLFLIGVGCFHLHLTYIRSYKEQPGDWSVLPAVIVCLSILTFWHSIALFVWALGFGCIFIHRGGDVFSRMLSIVRGFLLHPALQQLGKISYPLYLVHWPLLIGQLNLILWWHPNINSNSTVSILFFIGLPATLIVAHLLHIFIELPFVKLGKIKINYNEQYLNKITYKQ